MAIKTENILAIGSFIYADNSETKAPYARAYNSEGKAFSPSVTKNGAYIGKVVSLATLSKGLIQVEREKEIATSYVNSNGTTIKGKSKTHYVKVSEVNTQKALVVTLKTKYVKGTNVNVRPDASVSKKPIAVLQMGQPVSVTGRVLLGFTEISVITEGGSPKVGWIFSTYLSDTVPTATVPEKVTAKVKKKKTTVTTTKPNVDVTEYDKPQTGDSVEVSEDGKTGYKVVVASDNEINYGAIALTIMIVGGLFWVGKKIFKPIPKRQELNSLPARQPVPPIR